MRKLRSGEIKCLVHIHIELANDECEFGFNLKLPHYTELLNALQSTAHSECIFMLMLTGNLILCLLSARLLYNIH